MVSSLFLVGIKSSFKFKEVLDPYSVITFAIIGSVSLRSTFMIEFKRFFIKLYKNKDKLFKFMYVIYKNLLNILNYLNMII